MKQLTMHCAAVALILYIGNNLYAQGTNPAAMDMRHDPRQHRSSTFEQAPVTAESLESMGIKIIGATAQTPSRPSTAEELNGQLLLAIGNDDVEEATRLILAGANPEASISKSGMTPLMVCRSPKMVTTLLDKGADPNQKDYNGMTALHHLLFSEQAEEILPILLAAGAEVNIAAAGSNHETPLLAARQLFFEGGDPARGERIVRLLHQAGAQLDAQDELGYTVLITSAVNNKPHLTRLMLLLGANPHVLTKEGKTALSWALELGHGEIRKILLEYGACY